MHHFNVQRGFILRIFLIALLGITIFFFVLRALVLPPSSFPAGSTFSIKNGESLSGVAYRLSTEGYIKSPEAFKVAMMLLGGEQHVSVGEYYFDVPLTMLEIAFKISGRDFSILQNKVTFPEGFTRKDIAARLAAKFEGFDSATFLTLTKDDEGYLFPDTYSFSPSVTPDEAVRILKENFAAKTAPLESDFTKSIRSKKDVITMASIIEKEANGGEEMAIVAGILWKRIDKGIALQVDAPFLYILGKTSAELTVTDLSTNSSYNTYRYKGLPPTPIGNPGLAAIKAALFPTDSPYLYYLHDTNGQIHYASTYQEHLKNKNTYLK